MTLTIILLIIAGIAKAYMDKSAINQMKIRQLNKANSWVNKWALPFEIGKAEWYYLGLYRPKYKERFPFSSTILVMFTDFWHLMQFVCFTSLQIIIALNTDWVNIVVDLLIIKTLFNLIFELFYKYIVK